MNSNSNAVGLSAGQKININFNNFFWTFLVLLTLLFVTLVSTNTNGQQKESKKSPPKNGEPKIDIKINRHYDNHGNIIGYDSTYTFHYSSIHGDTLRRIDDMQKNFSQYFSEPGVSFFNKRFNNLFFNDTLSAPNLFRRQLFDDDYFLNRDMWHNLLDDMTQRLDSLKKGFSHDYKEKGRL